MKKLLKNILPVLKRAGALMGVVFVFVTSFLTPVFASGQTSTNSVDFYYSYWNLTKINCTYSYGTFAVFDMPQTF